MSNEPVATMTEVVDGVALTHVEPDGGASHASPIVFVHGGCHGSWCFAQWQSWFAARGWRSVALDWRSHGASEPMEHADWLRRPITAVAEDIEVAVTRLTEPGGPGGPGVVVVGQSMGGLATLHHAATTAHDLAAVVLMAPVLPSRFAPEPVDIEIDLEQPWGPPPWEVAHQLFWPQVDDETAREYYALLQPESPAAVWQATRWTADVDVEAVRAPVLVISAGNDVLAPADHVQALARGLGADAVHREHSGHALSLDPSWPGLADHVEQWMVERI